MTSKIKEAVTLCQRSHSLGRDIEKAIKREREDSTIKDADIAVRKEMEKKKSDALRRAISIYKELCQSEALSPTEKVDAIVSFVSNVPDEGADMITRYRDMVRFYKGKKQEEVIKMLCTIAKDSRVPSHERAVTATSLFNQGFIDVCYDCFRNIAVDKECMVKYRVESTRYLLANETLDDEQLAQECLLEIIDIQELSSEYRYEVIASFITKRNGISTLLNSTRLLIPYNEQFMHCLQNAFFFNDKNGVRERILSGQHILQMEEVEDSEKVDVANILLSFASNKEFEENTRADAADVLLRLSPNVEISAKARDIITDLGYSGLQGKSISERVRGIYQNSQNVHSEEIAKCVMAFIEKLISEKKGTIQSYSDVHPRLIEQAKKMIPSAIERSPIIRALQRISIDTATFSKYNVTLADLLCNVWCRILSYEDEQKQQFLFERLFEELKESQGTCSSGFASRMCNIFSAFEVELRIDFEDQIVGNVAGRMNARIRDCKDEDLRASIAMGMMDGCDEKDKETYVSFSNSALQEIKKEMYKEFVTDGYISKDKFELYFWKAARNWVITEKK